MAQDTPSESTGEHGPNAHVRVKHSAAQERYEAFVGEDWVGYLDYVPDHDDVSGADRVVITHTVIADRFSHHGYAASLVRHVLDDIAPSGRLVVPMCSYVQHFIAQNPSYASITVPVAR